MLRVDKSTQISNSKIKTKYYEFTPQILSAAFCYIILAQRCSYSFALFSYSKFKGGAAHVERSMLGTIAGVTLMCLLQAGRQADEQFTKFFDKEGGSDE